MDKQSVFMLLGGAIFLVVLAVISAAPAPQPTFGLLGLLSGLHHQHSHYYQPYYNPYYYGYGHHGLYHGKGYYGGHGYWG